MAQDLSRLLDRLNDLIALDLDAVNAYQAAIDRLSAPVIRERLREFQSDHRRHVRQLADAVTRYGGTPRSEPDLKGFLIKGFIAITSGMGDDAALRAMKTNEDLTTHSYQKALEDVWPPELNTLIAANYADEQHHLAFIEDAIEARSGDEAPRAGV